MSVLPPQIQSFSVTADACSRNICRGNTAFSQCFSYDSAVGLPHFFHVTLHKTGCRYYHFGSCGCHTDFPACLVINGGLCHCSSIIQSQKIFHVFMLLSCYLLTPFSYCSSINALASLTSIRSSCPSLCHISII